MRTSPKSLCALRNVSYIHQAADLVTETDRAVEDLVSSTLRQKYPSYKFMGEETYKPGDKLTDEPTFVVDPIDGYVSALRIHELV